LKDDASDLEQALAYHNRIRDCGTVIMDTVRDKEGNYKESKIIFLFSANMYALKLTTILASPRPFLYSIKVPEAVERQATFNKSAIVPSFSKELGAILVRHPLPTNSSVVVLHTCHGKGSRKDLSAAFGNRDPHILIGISATCKWSDVDTPKTIAPWVDEVYNDILAAGLHTGWKYINFNTREKRDGQSYLGAEGVRRMRQVKKKVDPHGLFTKSTPDLAD
jgi:hypothetical protein